MQCPECKEHLETRPVDRKLIGEARLKLRFKHKCTEFCTEKCYTDPCISKTSENVPLDKHSTNENSYKCFKPYNL